ncbi:hypothetical protein [Glycomyces buryatensis]|uniref:Uncharacterized protein n=1 Tax=Glycomyces buryatensis TaxID=2570927 RepID=A0A4S8Q8Z8_9ACTN|nr:hypothetical protein [Glycomyces buryatensis]THV40877.1 hypothetical protein FAB82_13565 [Glycomyces buryatensis]
MATPREALRAQALNEHEQANSILAKLPPEQLEHYYLLAMALFMGAIGHRLGERPAREEIDRVLAEMRYDFRGVKDEVNFLHVEALIRGLYGEDHLLEDVSSQDQYRAAMPVIYKVIGQSEQFKAQLDRYLDDAEKMVRIWQADEN